MASELPASSSLPDFRVRRLPSSSSETTSSRTTPWRSSPSAAAASTPAVNELQRDGVLMGPRAKGKAKDLSPRPRPVSRWGVRENDYDGVVRMTEQQYDDVLKQNEEAALHYVDEDDGEVVKVGSSLELRQRLAEPYVGATTAFPKMHEFDVQRAGYVIEIWKDLEERTKVEREATSKTTTSASATTKEAPPNYHYIDSDVGEFSRARTIPALQPQERSSLRARDDHGQPALKYQPPLPYENRWASYQSLPGQMDAKPTSMTMKSEKEVVHPAKSEVIIRPEDVPSPSSGDSSRQPLMEMFESELQKLMLKHPDAASPEPLHAVSPESTTAPNPTELQDNTSSDPPTSSVDQQSNDQASSSDINPGQLFANSLKSVLGGVIEIATSVIHDQVTNAQQELSNNFEHALRASASAVDQFNESWIPSEGNVPRHNSAAVTGQTAARASANSGTAAASADARTTKDSKSSAAHQETASVQETNVTAHSKGATSENGFQAEAIMARRYIYYDTPTGPRFTQYLVRWKGHGPETEVWYDVDNLRDCYTLVEEYEARHPRNVPRRADSPGSIKAYEQSVVDLHNRTAGDRMVTQNSVNGKHAPEAGYRKPTPRQAANTNSTTDLTAWSDSPGGDWLRRQCKGSVPPSKQSTPQEALPVDTPARRSSVSLDDILNPSEPSQTRDQLKEGSGRPLRHRHSWYPSSSRQESQNFLFSPASVMAKYPTVSELERESHSSNRTKPQKPQPPLQASNSYPDLGTYPSASETTDEASAKNEKKVSFASAAAPVQVPVNSLRRAKSLAFEHRPTGSLHPTVPPTDVRSAAQHEPPTVTSTQGPPPRRARTTRTRINAWPEAMNTVNPRRASYMDRSHIEVDRQNKIKTCERHLRQMGFSEAQSSAVALTVEGNLDKALDILEEDRAAWDGRRTSPFRDHPPRSNYPWTYFQPPMPGSFFPYQ